MNGPVPPVTAPAVNVTTPEHGLAVTTGAAMDRACGTTTVTTSDSWSHAALPLLALTLTHVV